MNLINIIKKIWHSLLWVHSSMITLGEISKSGSNSILEFPNYIENPKNLFLESNVSVRKNLSIINSPKEKVIIKKFTVIAANCTIITNSHQPTVGIPKFILCATHINDKSGNVVINEDVWVGANVTILAGVSLGRGCVVAAGSTVTKSVPPYSLVIGTPARIKGKIFNSLEDIIEHERLIYPKNERMKKEDLRNLFETYNYNSLKTFGVKTKFSQEQIETIKTVKENLKFVN